MGYNSIKLYGDQTCDYLYIQNSPIDNENFKNVDSEPQEWGDDTLLLSKFDNNLVAGNSALTDSIVGYEIRRKKGADTYTEYVGTIESTEDLNKSFIIDYAVKNNSSYTYYLYPASKSANSGAITYPFITDEISTDWDYWSLFVVDETDKENVFYLNKMFKFELNLNEEDMNNNASVTITKNFTKYPTVQYGTSNYWSGSLSALCGFISCTDTEYIQTPNMIDELKSLTSETRRMFLKNTDGNIWEVKIISPINISTENKTLQKIKTVKLSWAEVNDASKVSIINNPNKPTVNWLLTESGDVISYIEYVWDEHYRWNSSYKWTAQENILETETTNMGRNLYNKESDG